MFDEMEQLAGSPGLGLLLAHYADRAAPDRQAWQDRVMELDGHSGRELTGLHGELLAQGWIEQNTGVVSAPRRGAAPGCYRVTPAGLRALRESREQVG